ncbi:MAG TPA: VOC family protein [Capsulimonadaceae bacterium]|jgi:catechol 2,3-dioxygenase-like lactoylglutathione lyase family enzyme
MSHPKHGPGFHHVAIRAIDYDATLAFYKEAFGFERRYGWGEPGSRAAMLGVGDLNYVEVFEGRPAGVAIPEGGLLHYAIRVSDVDGIYAKAIAAGATSQVEPKDVPIQGDHVVNVRLAFLVGLDGEVIELFKNDEL